MKNYVWSTLIMLSVLFASCSMSKNNRAADSAAKLEDVTWRLTELEGKAVPKEINGKVPSLTFTSADKRYSAITGCNGIGGQYEIKQGNQLTLSMGMSTKMYCENNMEVEDGFGKLFPLVQRYTIESNRLELKDADSKVLATFVLMP